MDHNRHRVPQDLVTRNEGFRSPTFVDQKWFSQGGSLEFLEAVAALDAHAPSKRESRLEALQLCSCRPR